MGHFSDVTKCKKPGKGKLLMRIYGIIYMVIIWTMEVKGNQRAVLKYDKVNHVV